jgi:L-alanine-DL-glutamate epimerase-like enolase superfamily enzyme
MTIMHRRRFLAATALGLASSAVRPGLLRGSSPQSAARGRTKGPLEITDIEVHEILLPYHDFNAKVLFRYHGLSVQLRTVYVVKTDKGLEGYGESPGPAPPKDRVAKYLGTSPFDWLADTESLAMDMAMYDLMGKYLAVPAWKLLGRKVRDWVPVGAWAVSQPPRAMAEEVGHVSRRGFRWLKYHVDVLQNAIDQTAAMQEAAPPGFKVHYDFNADSNVEAVYPVLRELERFPIAGRIEDPINAIDREGYKFLRQKCRIPIVVHHAPHDVYMIEHLCDGVMTGHAPVGLAMKVSALAEATHTPFMLQQTGGRINQSFQAHEAAVFPLAVIPHYNDCNIWKEDVVTEPMPVVGGSVAVPDGPGLGVTLDRERLEKYERAPRPKQSRFLVRVRYERGPRIYFRYNPDVPGDNAASSRARFLAQGPGPLPGYANPVVSDFWDDEGSEDFERIWRLTESGPHWVAGP